MEVEKKITNLEQEFKLIKGEVKETLSSLRDYLIRVKLPLPPAEEAAVLGGIGGGEKSSWEGNLNLTPGAAGIVGSSPAAGAAAPEQPADTNVAAPASGSAGTSANRSGGGAGEAEAPPAEPGALARAAEPLAEYEELGEVSGAAPAEGVRLRQGPVSATPQPNLLANLIRWVASAKREIDDEQLVTFLEVYGISGGLSPELKDVILHMAEITEQQSVDAGKADVWSRLILELHGILSGGNTALYPVKPFWKDEGMGLPSDEVGGMEAEAEGAAGEKEDSLQMKLVLTDNKGKDREFSINLNPDDD